MGVCVPVCVAVAHGEALRPADCQLSQLLDLQGHADGEALQACHPFRLEVVEQVVAQGRVRKVRLGEQDLRGGLDGELGFLFRAQRLPCDFLGREGLIRVW